MLLGEVCAVFVVVADQRKGRRFYLGAGLELALDRNFRGELILGARMGVEIGGEAVFGGIGLGGVQDLRARTNPAALNPQTCDSLSSRISASPTEIASPLRSRAVARTLESYPAATVALG